MKPTGEDPRNASLNKESDEDGRDGEQPEEGRWQIDERERAQEAMKSSSRKPLAPTKAKHSKETQIQNPSATSSKPSSGQNQPSQLPCKSSTPAVAAYAHKRDANTTCHNCKKKGHTPNNCNYLCQRCGQRGHAARMSRGEANYRKVTNWFRRK